MTDPPGSIGRWLWLQSPWVPPIYILTLFKDADIQLNITISYPHPKSERDTWGAKICRHGVDYTDGIDLPMMYRNFVVDIVL
jgi:hypothetical protein